MWFKSNSTQNIKIRAWARHPALHQFLQKILHLFVSITNNVAYVNVQAGYMFKSPALPTMSLQSVHNLKLSKVGMKIYAI